MVGKGEIKWAIRRNFPPSYDASTYGTIYQREICNILILSYDKNEIETPTKMGPIEDPIGPIHKSILTSAQYGTEKFEESPQLSPHCYHFRSLNLSFFTLYENSLWKRIP